MQLLNRLAKGFPLVKATTRSSLEVLANWLRDECQAKLHQLLNYEPLAGLQPVLARN